MGPYGNLSAKLWIQAVSSIKVKQIIFCMCTVLIKIIIATFILLFIKRIGGFAFIKWILVIIIIIWERIAVVILYEWIFSTIFNKRIGILWTAGNLCIGCNFTATFINLLFQLQFKVLFTFFNPIQPLFLENKYKKVTIRCYVRQVH